MKARSSVSEVLAEGCQNVSLLLSPGIPKLSVLTDWHLIGGGPDVGVGLRGGGYTLCNYQVWEVENLTRRQPDMWILAHT